MDDDLLTPTALQSVRPNPSRGPMTLALTLPRAGVVRLEAFDLSGRRVADTSHALSRPGPHELAWAGQGRDGRRLAPGTYLLRLSLGAQRIERKVLLMP